MNSQNQQFEKDILPLIILDNIVIFPRVVLPLILKKPESLTALEFAMKNESLVVFMVQKGTGQEFYNIGTACRVIQILKIQDGSVKIIIEGISRVKIKKFTQKEPFLKVQAEPIVSEVSKNMPAQALMRSILAQFRECVNLGKIVPLDVLMAIFSVRDPETLVDLIVFNLDLKIEERQRLLEMTNTEKRLEELHELIAREIEILKTGQKLQKETAKKLGKMSKEVFLREQLKSIEKELGIGEERDEIKELKKALKKAKMPKPVEKTAMSELARMEKMPSFSPEVSYIRTYLEWLKDLPWSKKSDCPIDLKKAKKVLDEDHYGLEKTKERVLEYLAVQKLVGKMKGPILSFIGPPGTGKTSIGKSIARALGRKFYRMSLGGIRDEAEIRGHRRTYVGALPGRIIQGIKTAGVKNPVFMLDEIDKVGSDFRGDPTSALLEALDPEQNNSFSDHYLEVPFDLSDVMFITTGNILDTIPHALRDRMEVIYFPGYTDNEKFNIAKKYLIPKLLKEHGLKAKNLLITDAALKKIIQEYTREAGVRNLEREIAKICRKTARQITEGKKIIHKVSLNDLKRFLGPIKFQFNHNEKKDEIGVAVGLAWTEAGGDILSIEAIKMPGTGKLILTGSLGKVMQESARAAFSYAKAKAGKSYQNQDIHIHVPSGAIPKDGPSAGITMASALVSVLTEKPVNHKIAMTGEVTLRGQVLEIGGIKEKVLAAKRAGIKQVILPKDNKKNLDDIPKDVRKKMEFIFVSHMDEVLKRALVGE
ncbi:MAG: endopeptidase La [bacterium]